MVLTDSFGRPLLNLRVAITNKCNLTCSFCHGEGEEKGQNSGLEMTRDEVVQIAKIAASLGARKVKITGGEPLVREDVAEIVGRISNIEGVSDLSMTTNGTLLEPMAKKLHANGLQRINISLPTIDAEVYHKLTGGTVEDVLSGVKAAVDVGLSPVKLNMIILKGINDSAVPEIINFAKETHTILQLIELEPINIEPTYYSIHHKSLDQFETALEKSAIKVETRRYMQNRRVYHLPDAKVEVVRPTENTEFCLNCTRLRVTSNGKLKPCLMRNDNLVDILKPMRNGASDEELVKLFRLANDRRQPFNGQMRCARGRDAL